MNLMTITTRSAIALSVVLVVLLGCLATSGAEQFSGLRILVLEGDDAVNIIDKKTAVKPTVEVRDQNDLPVSGASVVFLIQGGDGATFANGLRQVTLTTNSLGRATVTELNPLSKGAFQIQARATFQGQTATVTIHQANVATAAEAAQAAKPSAGQGAAAGAAGGGGLSHAAIAGILAGVGGAATTVAVVKASGGGSAGSTPAAVTPAPAATPTPTPIPTPVGATSANIQFVFTPNPVPYDNACINPGSGTIPPYASYRVEVRETAGVAFTVTRLTKVFQFFDGTSQTATSSDLTGEFTGCGNGTISSIPANGFVCTQQCTYWGLSTAQFSPIQARQYTVSGTDAKGNQLTFTSPVLMFVHP